jgi:hypothetical protein
MGFFFIPAVFDPNVVYYHEENKKENKADEFYKNV